MSFSLLVNVCFVLYNSSHNTKDRALLESNSSVVLFNVSGRELPAFSACLITFTMYWLTYVLSLNTYLSPELSTENGQLTTGNWQQAAARDCGTGARLSQLH